MITRSAYPRSARAVRSRVPLDEPVVLLSEDIPLEPVVRVLLERGVSDMPEVEPVVLLFIEPELLVVEPVVPRFIEPLEFVPLPLGAVCVLVLGPAVSFAPAGFVLLPVSLMAPEPEDGLVLVCA